eukprot:10018584-Prorocentrum_lima.AAC.1
MTSSLVGSEMCIRDSLCLAPSTGLPLRLSTVPVKFRHDPGGFLHHAPVSYTHLTLPTICSV